MSVLFAALTLVIVLVLLAIPALGLMMFLSLMFFDGEDIDR